MATRRARLQVGIQLQAFYNEKNTNRLNLLKIKHIAAEHWRCRLNADDAGAWRRSLKRSPMHTRIKLVKIGSAAAAADGRRRRVCWRQASIATSANVFLVYARVANTVLIGGRRSSNSSRRRR